MTSVDASPSFVHLRTHSEFSVVDGTARIGELVAAAAAYSQPAIALTDLSNLFGLIKFYKTARSKGIKPIAGCDVWLANEQDRDKPFRVLLLVQNREGYLALCELLARAWTANQYKGRAELQREWLQNQPGLILLSGGMAGDVGQALQGVGRGQAGAAEAADRLDRAIDAMRATVEAELTRSRLAGQSRGGSAPILDVVEQVVQVLEQTEKGEALAFSIEIPEALSAPLNRDDLTDLLGPLMENAVRFARRRVAVSAIQDEARLVIAVEDDGPGIPSERADAASHRGVRLDEQGAGQGLGLSIARSYAENTGGLIRLSRSVFGGLRVEIIWPHPF